jgi:hypothetical protein
MGIVRVRGIGLGLMTCALLFSSGLASAASSATVVGQITCGADENTPAAHIEVVAEGLALQTQTDDTGRFALADLPAGQAITIEAVSDPEASLVVKRGGLVLEAGETLDVGSMDLPVCGQPVAPQSDQDYLVTDR